MVTADVSMKPWGDYSQSDYTPQQWHDACLIHNHSGPPMSKAQCKLPVRTPDGKLNRQGLGAAAAALNGARGGLIASAATKTKAAKDLLGLYKQANVDPPDSLKHDNADNFMEHWGVKGMRWGVQNAPNKRISVDSKRTQKGVDKSKVHGLSSLSNHELQGLNKRLELEKKFSELNKSPSKKGYDSFKNGHAFIKDVIGVGTTMTTAYAFAKSPVGQAIGKALVSKLGRKVA